MVFKLKASKEEKYKCILLPNAVALFILLIFSVILQCQRTSINMMLVFVLLFWLPLVFANMIFASIYLEWFIVYEDRIEAKCLLYTKNIVYVQDVTSIEPVIINLTSRGTEKPFYILHDGRKDTNNILGALSCYNRRNLSFRIHQTDKLDAVLKQIWPEGDAVWISSRTP